jgi:hypothetical protein
MKRFFSWINYDQPWHVIPWFLVLCTVFWLGMQLIGFLLKHAL